MICRCLRPAVVLAVVLALALPTPTLAAVGVRGGDKTSQTNLRNGMWVAVSYHKDKRTYKGFNAARADAIAPGALTWADGDAVAQDVVNIGYVSPRGTKVMLEILSSSGTSFCVADNATRPHGTVTGSDTSGATFKNYHGCRHAPSGTWS